MIDDELVEIDPSQREMMRQAAWDMYASAVLGMTLHPGTTRDAAVARTLEEMAAIADSFLALRDLRFGRARKG